MDSNATTSSSSGLVTKLCAALKWLSERFDVWKFGRWEVLIMRILFACLLYQTMPLGNPFSNFSLEHLRGLHDFAVEHDGALRPPLVPLTEFLPNSEVQLTFDTQPVPNGLARFFDFTFFASDGFVKVLPWIVIPCLLLYASGWGLPVVLPILTFISIGSRTLANSQGAIHHGFQIVSVVLLAQTVVVLFGVGYRLFKKRAFVDARGRTVRDYFIYYAQLAVVAFYLIAGVIKLINSDGAWIANSHLIGVQLVKTERQGFYNDLDTTQFEGVGGEVPLADTMLNHPNLTRAFMSMGLMLELFAFLALLGRGWASIFGLLVVCFHWFNDVIMKLYFYNNEKVVWIFLINVPFWIYFFTRNMRKQPQEVGTAESATEPASA